MEIWSVKNCKFCMGFGVRATPMEYKEWRQSMDAFTQKIAAKNIARRRPGRHVALAIIAFSNKLTEGKPKCSFCNGAGAWERRETDATVEEAGSEEFWKSDGQ